MDVKIQLSVDEKGRKICKLEDEKIIVHLTLKRDYSNFESKLKAILEDIEDALEAASETDEFKDLVDSSGLLYVDRISE
ncbi:MAG: hypothetical protein HVN35_02655 [Methanobacteriaceae archaeon]|nr:hypothetical protein [Methanobacteriaceae archaeon]